MSSEQPLVNYVTHLHDHYIIQLTVFALQIQLVERPIGLFEPLMGSWLDWHQKGFLSEFEDDLVEAVRYSQCALQPMCGHCTVRMLTVPCVCSLYRAYAHCTVRMLTVLCVCSL